MNDLNFRNLQNLTVPDDLMERLFAIPETEDKKPAVIPLWRNRAIITAASLVLVSVLSLTAYFLFGIKSNTPIPLAPSTQSTNAPSQKEQSSGVTPIQPQDRTAPTDGKFTVHQPNESLLTTPTESGANTQPTEKRQSPTTNKTEATTPPIVPAVTEQSTETPAERPTEPPTETPDVLEPTEGEPEPVNPTEPPPWMPDPTEPPQSSASINVALAKSKVPADGLVYCQIMDENGAPLGDYDMFAQERLVDVIPFTRYYDALQYRATDYISLPYNMTVRYIFYGSDGAVIYSGTAYLDNNQW